jgi:heat shock protein HtpX
MVCSWFWGGGRRRSRNDNAGGVGAILAVISIALLILAPLFAGVIQMAVSRKREYLADANGALLTRYPAGLAGALRKIAADTNPLRAANKATSSMYIYNPLKDIRGGKGLNSLFDTHPPIEERIRRLEAM